MEDMREEATPTSNQQPQPQNRTPSETVEHAEDQGPGIKSEGQNRGVRRRRKEAQEPQKSCKREVENGEESGGTKKNVDTRVVIQSMST